ncbi:ABC-three component system protein [Rhizobium terrae]|uniref:ABC-three component system protein n=1 Tax=Rhizobium terrae TaxID=2171756 RepID=UPI000E3C51C3|nr:ABC-three component system protein [Rhizobium terrae]
MTVVELDKPLKTSAAGQYLGFSLQQLRLTYYLLRVPDGDHVSLEYLDDVAIHRADGSVLLEQCKSALSGNPAADRSVDLWKTFANWSTLCKDGVVDVQSTSFHYYVTPSKSGSIVKQMSSAENSSDVAAVIVRLKKLANSTPSDALCHPHISKFLAAGDVLCGSIISRFTFSSEDESLEAVRQYVRPGASPAALQELTAAAIGIARDRVDNLIRSREAPIVDATKFRRSFQSFSRRSDLGNLLVSKTPPPTDDVVASTVSNEPTFVRQLYAVEATEDMLLTAVSDYLRTQIDKVEWADDGRILVNSFDEFDEQLVRLHKINRDEIEDLQSTSSQPIRGRTLYRKCASAVVPLDGQTLPGHFVAGAFNHLADSKRVGWHPDFATLFPVD